MNKKANKVKELRIQDPYNPDKIWLIKKYSYHIKATQLIAGKQIYNLKRISKNWLLEIFNRCPEIHEQIKNF